MIQSLASITLARISACDIPQSASKSFIRLNRFIISRRGSKTSPSLAKSGESLSNDCDAFGFRGAGTTRAGSVGSDSMIAASKSICSFSVVLMSILLQLPSTLNNHVNTLPHHHDWPGKTRCRTLKTDGSPQYGQRKWPFTKTDRETSSR